MKKITLFFVTALFLFVSGNALANKTAVKVSVPDKVKKGSQVTITINVIHKGNTTGHHTDWVYLKINGKEVKRWSYDKNTLPPDGNFTLTYTYTITENSLNIEAEGDCNIHGTVGPAKASVKIQP